MIIYYTNREISEKLNINLARWKRWSRSFLPPDPLGGMQSGYARQYAFKDLFKVFLGGHLLSHLKLCVPDSQIVLADLSPWLKKNGFLDLSGTTVADLQKTGQSKRVRIYFRPLRPLGVKSAWRFGYLMRTIIGAQADASVSGRRIIETYQETFIHFDMSDGHRFLDDPHVHMINLGALFDALIDALGR